MSKPKKSAETEIPDSLLKVLLTDSELRMLNNRYNIMQLLAKGSSIRKVAQKVGVGSDTVVRVSRILKKENLKNKLDQIKNNKTSKSQYVFGNNED